MEDALLVIPALDVVWVGGNIQGDGVLPIANPNKGLTLCDIGLNGVKSGGNTQNSVHKDNDLLPISRYRTRTTAGEERSVSPSSGSTVGLAGSDYIEP